MTNGIGLTNVFIPYREVRSLGLRFPGSLPACRDVHARCVAAATVLGDARSHDPSPYEPGCPSLEASS